MAVEQDHNERTVVERRDSMIGEVFDRRFRIEARIAAGGFGAIYRATHVKSGHQLALKVLHANLTHDAGVVARFRREGAALTRLRDSHTITAYELGEAPDGRLYIVLELLHGESLYERFRATGPLPWQRVFAIARAVCSSLSEAHTLGIIHRDLKPTNIHLEPINPDEDHVKVLDFGIAKIVQHSDIDSGAELTHAGQMIGTLDYMSPEQMVGGMCDATSDIYSLGVVMYEMISGRKPYDDANSAAAALAAVLTTTPARLTEHATIPADADRLVMRCIERQYTDRFQSATELAEAIDELLVSGEEAVTTIDLTHPHGGATTIKGMRLPVRPPAESPPPTRSPRATPVPPSIVVAPEVAAQMASTSVPVAVAHAPAPMAPVATAASATEAPAQAPQARGSVPPVPRLLASEPAPLVVDTTIVGPMPATRRPARRSARRQRPNGTAQVAAVATPRNLREAYPTIRRVPPSPMRPQPSVFDDRPPSSIGTGKVYDMSSSVRRDAFVRQLIIGIAVAVAILIALLVLG